MPEFFSLYGKRPGHVYAPNRSPSRTKQSFKDECDINKIMRRYVVHGVLPQGVGVAKYGDFSEAGTYLEAQNIIIKARAQFSSLPSKVRERFRNDPAEFLKFVQDKGNAEEAQQLGLLREELRQGPNPDVKQAAAAAIPRSRAADDKSPPG